MAVETTPVELPIFHDVHAHAIQHQRGGFLIALEGEPVLSYMQSNRQILEQEDRSRLLLAVPYVRNVPPEQGIDHPVVKYHARREGYSPEWVSADIARHARRLALVDTLNAIDWEPRCYLDLARAHPKTQFLFCHAGGYDILQFLKMARFVPNVWIDFAATQDIFGWASGRSNFPAITDAMDHAFAEPRIARKVLFGTDIPEWDQLAGVRQAVERLCDPHPYLAGNFERLVEIAGL